MKNESIPHTIIKGNVSVMDRLKGLNETERHAVLASDSDGQPYTSLIAHALSISNYSLIFATPKDSQKFRNIIKNPRVSLLLDNRMNTDEDYMAAESITIQGIARPVEKGNHWIELSEILSKKHPYLKDFIKAPSTALIEVDILYCIHVSQFQTITEWRREESAS